MSPRLALHFLGPPQINLDDKPIRTDRRKAVALLAYLAMNRGEHTREFLSGLLWPDYDQAKAYSNLRRTIWEILQAIGEDWLLADRESVSLENGKIDFDVAQFQGLFSQARRQSDITLRIPLLFDAVKLYRNHFLTGFSLKDSYPFNEWAYAESEELRRQLAGALTTISEDYCALGQAEEAIPHARRLISLDPLNESAHHQLMEVYIQAGQHSAALKQYQTCEKILRKELNLDPQPETRELYKKIRKREIKSVRVEEKVETSEPKHNLPLQLSSFIGREKEAEDVSNLVAKHRLVTLAGVGGIGKTRLALQVGQKLLSDYRDGVWFIPLDSLADPTLVPQTVASVFDIREGSERPIIEILKHVLRRKTALLILDNCEHLLEGCAQLINALLTSCPNLKILATSRGTLNITGEAIYLIPSLSLPEQDASLETVMNYESVKLFTERAALALSSFTLTKANAQPVVDICRRIDGIPLAIELSAARVNILQVEEILKQLDDSFALLASDNRNALQRHQTLRASLDWSWSLLSKAEQTFLRQLSVFAGGWTLESAQAICDSDVLGLTSALVKKSLIAVDQEVGRETRYRFHEIVRQYVREKLVQSGEEGDIHTRHLNYFSKVSKQAELALRGPEQGEWSSRLFDESDNLRVALGWANKTNVEAGLFILGRLLRFWENFNVRESVHWLEVFLHKSESKDFPLARAGALFAYGWLSIWLQQTTRVRDAAQESLDLFRACGNRPGEVDAMLLLGYVIFSSSETTSITQIHKQALEIAESLNDLWRQASALFWWGWDHSDWQSAFARWERALVLYREVGDWNSQARILGGLGMFRVLNGDVELAQNYIDEATRLSQFYKVTEAMEESKTAKSLIALMNGNYEQARTLLKEIIVDADDLGNRLSYVWSRTRLGYVALREGNLEEARNLFAETASIFQNDNDEGGVAFTLEGVAGLYIATNKPAIAARLIGWADAIRKKIKDTRPLLEQADVDKIIAACIIKMGEVAFSDAYDEGQKMTLDEAVAYALEERR